MSNTHGCRLRLKCDGTCAETRFRLTVKRTSPFKSAGGISLVDYWQASCAHQPAGFTLLVQACVLQSCDTYWLPIPFPCFPFTSTPVRHRVPSHFNWSLKALENCRIMCTDYSAVSAIFFDNVFKMAETCYRRVISTVCCSNASSNFVVS
jgi:hypothetical protein